MNQWHFFALLAAVYAAPHTSRDFAKWWATGFAMVAVFLAAREIFK